MIIEKNLTHIRHQIHLAEKKYHRNNGEVNLLAVSKKQSIEKIREAFLAGQTRFGENYVQEALEKQALLKELPIEWHFIGSIQSNKTKLIATHFDWVHSVDRLSIAKRLNAQRPTALAPLNICIEVNIDNSPTKSGAMVESINVLAQKIKTFDRLKLRGLMMIPDQENAPYAFQKAKTLYDQLIQTGFMLDTLSMGMSHDFEYAIQAGSTLVRIGTAIFGERQ